MRRLKHFKSREGENSLWEWEKVKNPLRVVFNFVIIYSARYLPSLRLKNFFYRLVGIKVGRKVSVGLGAVFDIFFPELIEIGDNTIIGYNTVVLAHEFLVNEYRTGRVEIGKNVLIGANCTVLPGIKIGVSATVSACSLVNKNVPAGAFVGGVPIKQLKKSLKKENK
ncbi:acyltransferase [Candidatus Micrarchaeota archaeon]|nr:acyltransferase [Candidatus Micrarchaeota archaeon]